jgi:hypothetical protein
MMALDLKNIAKLDVVKILIECFDCPYYWHYEQDCILVHSSSTGAYPEIPLFSRL